MAEGGPLQYKLDSLSTPENYEYEARRVATFGKWPSNAVIGPHQLASVGFIYTGEGTLVQCFCCGVRYRDWHKGDNPLTIHQKCNPRCPFLRNLTCKRKPLKQLKKISKPPEVISNSLTSICELKEERPQKSEQVAGNLPQ